MTHDEKIALVGEAAAARIGLVMRELPGVASYALRSMPFIARVALRSAIEHLEATERALLMAARADQDGVPTESLICGLCGEHESRCQCEDHCRECGLMECIHEHETDAAGYEPRERA